MSPLESLFHAVFQVSAGLLIPDGRWETLTIGRYGSAGISLAMAREKLLDARKAVAQGKSPAHEKQREKRRLTAAKNFGEMTARWRADAKMADSTRAMRNSIVDRDILLAFKHRQLNEITADDLRALCKKVKARGAPAAARIAADAGSRSPHVSDASGRATLRVLANTHWHWRIRSRDDATAAWRLGWPSIDGVRDRFSALRGARWRGLVRRGLCLHKNITLPTVVCFCVGEPSALRRAQVSERRRWHPCEGALAKEGFRCESRRARRRPLMTFDPHATF